MLDGRSITAKLTNLPSTASTSVVKILHEKIHHFRIVFLKIGRLDSLNVSAGRVERSQCL